MLFHFQQITWVNILQKMTWAGTQAHLPVLQYEFEQCLHILQDTSSRTQSIIEDNGIFLSFKYLIYYNGFVIKY